MDRRTRVTAAIGAEEASRQEKRTSRSRNLVILLAVGLVWFGLDMLTKSWINGSYEVGQTVVGPILGLVQFTLVHNTGMAWGMFGDSTTALGVMSLVVCCVLIVYLLALSPRASVAEAVGIALVVAGGLGNVLDRFTLGYVVDFIEPVFIDFPVFNVADIGVTCGFVLFLGGLLLRERREAARERALMNGDASQDSQGPDLP